MRLQGFPERDSRARIGFFQRLAALAGAATVLGLAGCGLGVDSPLKVPTEVLGAAFHGRVYGGQQPITGATIKLYAAGLTGYGSAPTYVAGDDLLGNHSILTGLDGEFDISGDYTCPSASVPVYLVALGGNPGAATVNPNSVLMVGLGPCGSLSSVPFINGNEVTTAATIIALAPFITGIHNIGAPATNVTGLANAFADINLLVNIGTGTSPGPAMPPGMSVPAAELYTLGNILAACVNTTGGTYNDGSACGNLFGYTNPGSTPATAATDTATAMMNLAQHPELGAAHNIALFNLPPPTAAFGGSLKTAPSDYTLAVTMTGAGLAAPSALAADGAGNVYVANRTANTVTKLTHTGTNLSGSGYTASLNAPSSIAVASNGVLWIANRGNNTVSRMSALDGTAQAAVSGGGLNLPMSIALDAHGTAWVANSGDPSFTTIDSAGVNVDNHSLQTISNGLAIAITPH